MKRSLTGSQTLEMNRTDFERAAGGRKVKFNFTLAINKGKIQNSNTLSPLARELGVVLQENPSMRELVRPNDYEFSMNSSFQLTIINNSVVTEEPSNGTQETETENATE